MSRLEANKSSLFLLPMVDLNVDKICGYNNCFINTYFDDNYNIYLLFHLKNLDSFVITEIENNKNFIGSYRDNYIGTFKMQIPDIMKNDFNLFLRGHYSKFSKSFKNILNKNYSINSTIRRIINPSDDDIFNLRKALNLGNDVEISEIYDIVNYNLEKYDNMYILLKPENEQYSDLAIGFYDSAGRTTIITTIGSNIKNKEEYANNLINLLNNNKDVLNTQKFINE